MEIRPGAALRPGRTDPVILLVLWCLRRVSWTVVLLGMSYAWLAGAFGQLQSTDLTTPGDLASALLSPLVGIALGVVLRLAVSAAAVVAALPLARWPDVDVAGRSQWGLLLDRIRLAQAYKSLRWTSAVRREAAGRAGDTGAALSTTVGWSSVSVVVAALLFVVVMALTPGRNTF